MLSPFWAVFSILVEVLLIPLQLTFICVSNNRGRGALIILSLITTPILFVLLFILCTFLGPVSFVMKIYEAILADDFNGALKSLVYPDVHPIYGDWLNIKIKSKHGKVAPSISSAETAISYEPPGLSFGHGEINPKDSLIENPIGFEKRSLAK